MSNQKILAFSRASCEATQTRGQTLLIRKGKKLEGYGGQLGLDLQVTSEKKNLKGSKSQAKQPRPEIGSEDELGWTFGCLFS